MSGPSDEQPDRTGIRTRIMGLGERAGCKSYYPQLQARIRELEEKSAALSRMLEELDGARHRAEESEKRFRVLFEHISDGILVVDLEARQFVMGNESICRMLGYSRDELPGLSLDDHPVADLLRISEEGHGRDEFEEPVEASVRRRDGGIFWAEIRTTHFSLDGRPYLMGVFRNITEQVRLREQKDQIEQQYHQAQKMEAIGQLAGGIAHDLNNLLCPILGYGEMLLFQFSPGDSRRQSVEEIHRAGAKARDLVRQLLALSRKQALEVKVVDLNEAISGFGKLMRRMLRENIHVHMMLSPSIPAVRADVGQIEQVIMNLVVNAQDAMPDGGRLSIETGVATLDESYAAEHHGVQPGLYVLLAVSDTGHGMDAHTREHIFDPFFTTKEKGKGTGLGLATVYGIVKQHGGSIWVYTEAGKGSTFKVYLPAVLGAAVERPRPLPVLTGSGGTETVLLAEDSEMVRNLAVNILKQEGYTVLSGSNGAECLRLLGGHKGPLDILITDVVMPDMNGKSLFEQVSALYPGVKVLYMSGYTDNVIVQHGVLEEGIAFIQKPFTAQSLAVKVREILSTQDRICRAGS